MSPDFVVQDIVETYSSFIWTDRYDLCGDFELYLPVKSAPASLLVKDNYLSRGDSDRLMIIETVELTTNADSGDFYKITGKSLESILNRRIIRDFTILTGSLQESIHYLLNRDVIYPSLTARKISNFDFVQSTDPLVTTLTTSAQYRGENLYDTIVSLCQSNGIGFKTILGSDFRFKFQLFCGKDRSQSQSVNPCVIFSPTFDNLLSSDFVDSNASWKNCSLVGGEGDGAERRVVDTASPSGSEWSGLARREVFTDAAGASSKNSDGSTINDTDYANQLIQKGQDDLATKSNSPKFDGSIAPGVNFKYNEDYSIGDVIQLEDGYGNSQRVIITEYIYSVSDTEVKEYPTLTALEEATDGS